MEGHDFTDLATTHSIMGQEFFRLYIVMRCWRDGFASLEQLLEVLKSAEQAEEVALAALSTASEKLKAAR